MQTFVVFIFSALACIHTHTTTLPILFSTHFPKHTTVGGSLVKAGWWVEGCVWFPSCAPAGCPPVSDCISTDLTLGESQNASPFCPSWTASIFHLNCHKPRRWGKQSVSRCMKFGTEATSITGMRGICADEGLNRSLALKLTRRGGLLIYLTGTMQWCSAADV